MGLDDLTMTDQPEPPPEPPALLTPADHQRLHLPPEPGDHLPHLRSAWRRMVQGPVALVGPSPARHARVGALERQSRRASAATRILSSRNWSGATITPHCGQQFVLAFGAWTVPTPKLPPNPDQQGPGDYACSAWIGSDGARRYLDASLPQIGTEQRLRPDTPNPVCNAFFQWWSPHEAHPKDHYHPIPGLLIEPGSQVMAMLWAIDPTHVVAALRTFGPHPQLAAQLWQAPLLTLDNGIQTRPVIAGATAEWIVERPRNISLQRFPDYGQVDFTHCIAATAPIPGPPTREQILAAPKLLRMFEVPPNTPSRTRMISHARRTADTDCQITYGSLP